MSISALSEPLNLDTEAATLSGLRDQHRVHALSRTKASANKSLCMFVVAALVTGIGLYFLIEQKWEIGGSLLGGCLVIGGVANIWTYCIAKRRAALLNNEDDEDQASTVADPDDVELANRKAEAPTGQSSPPNSPRQEEL